MTSRWFRSGDFSTLNYPELRALEFSRLNLNYQGMHTVEYHYHAASPINSIHIESEYSHSREEISSRLKLYVYDQKAMSIHNTFREHFHPIYPFHEIPGQLTHLWQGYYSCAFGDEDTEDTLQFLLKINKNMKESIFDPFLINELQIVSDYISFLNKQKDSTSIKINHTIPTYSPSETYVNPDRKHSNALSEILNKDEKPKLTLAPANYRKYRPTFSTAELKRFKKLLQQGENPNQRDRFGITLFYIALSTLDLNIISLLLRYHANPFERHNGDQFFSAYDRVKQYEIEYPDIYDPILSLITSATFKLERPLKAILNNSALTRINNTIQSHFAFNNGEVFNVELKSTKAVTPEEARDFINFGAGIFSKENDPDGKKIRQTIADELTTPNRFIETIRNKKNEAVGYVVLEIVHPKNAKKAVHLYTSLAFIDPKYRDYSLMPLLIFRLGYALQLLLKDYTVGVFMMTTCYKSYSLAEDELHYPMYKTKTVIKTVDELIKHVEFNQDVSYYHDGLTVRVPNQIAVNGNKKSNKVFRESHFDNKVLGLPEQALESFHAVPVLFFISDLGFQSLSTLCNKMGLKLYDHLVTLAREALPLLKSYFNKYEKLTLSKEFFSDTTQLFWKQCKTHPKLTQSSYTNYQPSTPSKL